MATRKTIDEEIRQVEDLKDLMGTLESIAALYMRRVKESVVESRAFYNGLHIIYGEVAEVYASQPVKKVRGRFKRGIVDVFKTRKKTEAVILLSVNSGLYGDVVEKTFRSFLTYARNNQKDADIIIVGLRGKLLFKERLPRASYHYYEYPDGKLDQNKFIEIVRSLASYERVHVFYGKFESFISQVAVESELGRQLSPRETEKQPRVKIPSTAYLFEPSLDEVAHFFETEIFTSLFDQIFHESHLAKLASRMFMLDAATVHAEQVLRIETLSRQKIIHQELNKRQLGVMSSRIALGI